MRDEGEYGADLWPGCHGRYQGETGQAESGPNFPDPLFRIAFRRDSELFCDPVTEWRACSDDESTRGGVAEPCCKGGYPRIQACSCSSGHRSDEVKKSQRECDGKASRECRHLYSGEKSFRIRGEVLGPLEIFFRFHFRGDAVRGARRDVTCSGLSRMWSGEAASRADRLL